MDKIKIIDTHSHLNDQAFAADLDAVILRARAAGVDMVINAADTAASIAQVTELTRRYPDFFKAAVGIHPNEVVQEDDLATVRAALNTVGVCAIGEIGLDFHYAPSLAVKKRQVTMFKAQLDLAACFNLPAVIHSRDADEATFSILAASGLKIPLILHCFSGSPETAAKYLRSGLEIYFGIGGVLTFKNARKLVETVELAPLENLLLETDAPYLAPQSHRGERNEPSFLIGPLTKISELKKLSVADTAAVIYATSKRVFNLAD